MQINKKKYSPNYKTLIFKPIVLCLIVLLSTALLAQDESSQEPQSETPQIKEDHDTKNLDKLLKEYNQDTQKVINNDEKIQKMDDTGELNEKELSNGLLNDSEKPEILSQNGMLVKGSRFRVADNKKTNYSDAISAALSTLQKLPAAELEGLLKDSFKTSGPGAFFANSPRFILLLVRLIKDKKALPSLVKILDDQSKLIKFYSAILFTFILGIFLKKIMRKEGQPISIALWLWFVRFSIIYLVRFIIIFMFYGNEISPALNIVSHTFFY